MGTCNDQFRPKKVFGAKNLIECGFYDEIADYIDEVIVSGRTERADRFRRALFQLSPSQFEHFIAGHFDRMGYDVQPTGHTSFKDGGIDLVAVDKKRRVGSCLIAVQVKHHKRNRKTGRPAVDRLLAWKDSHFRIGVLVTNTAFTKDAAWLASQVNNQPFVRLRDFSDLKRWTQKDYWSKDNWREIPDKVNLAPGVTIPIPKSKLASPLEA